MSAFERFDRMLAAARPGDAWGDDGVLHAAELLRSFQPDDWGCLANNWGDRAEVWQCFAADVLLDADQQLATPVLLDMIERGKRSVRLGACDTLRTLLQGRTEPLTVSPSVLAVITDLERVATGLAAWSLRELQKFVR